jgi:acyl-CoA synthetase (AMP-forming)/AMP-acid ligase II
MLGSHLCAEAARGGERLALIHGAQEHTYGQVAERIEEWIACRPHLAGKRVGLEVQDPFTFLAAVAGLDLLGAHTFLACGRSDSELADLRERFSWDAVLRESDLENDGGAEHRWRFRDRPLVMEGPVGRGLVTLLTSGTTGAPKAANHTWATLAGPVRRDEHYRDTRWLTAYPLHLYAGCQVLLQALLNGAVLVVPDDRDPRRTAQALQRAKVTHASGTPTFWRQLFLFADPDDLRQCRLEQITMGGETVTQDVLDGVKRHFPGARLVHIYASTEAGRLFTVTDGKEGFPARYLESSPEEGIELRILDGQLLARSRNSMLGYENGPAGADADAWFCTGDLIEVRGDRVHFAGRNSEIINVGGAKVHPAAVECVLREVPGVADVRVYGRASALVGALVAADVLALPGVDPQEVQAAVARLARERLQPFQVPRLVRMVQQIEVNQACKVVRRDQA